MPCSWPEQVLVRQFLPKECLRAAVIQYAAASDTQASCMLDFGKSFGRSLI